MKNETIKTVGDFLKVVSKLYPDDEQAFFRGQSSNSYDVNSSFYRLVKDNGIDNEAVAYQLANKLSREFKNNMPIFSENNVLRDYTLNDVDLLMVAQHYGLATRLIDWTKNPLVALYFATEKESPKNDCSVFMMYHVDTSNVIEKINSHAFESNVKNEQRIFREFYQYIEENMDDALDFKTGQALHYIVNSQITDDYIYPPIQVHETLISINFPHMIMRMSQESAAGDRKNISLLSLVQKNTVNYVSPISAVKIFNNAKYIIEPLPLNHRIKNQQGVFVFANKLTENVVSNNEINESNILTHTNIEPSIEMKQAGVFRIDISKEYIPSIQKELNMYGISKDFIYPELPSYTEVMQKKAVSEIKRGKI